MSEQNHNRMREWMDRESKVDDQYARDTYFLVNWQELSILQFWYDKTQKPHSVWIRRAWFTQQSTNVSYSQVSDYEEIKKEDAEERWNYSVKEAGFVRWTPYAPECHENDSTVKFHRIVKNEDDVYQTLWSDHGETSLLHRFCFYDHGSSQRNHVLSLGRKWKLHWCRRVWCSLPCES